MKNRRRINFLLGLLTGFLGFFSPSSPLEAKSIGWNADALEVDLAGKNQLPPARAGVTELKFADFYVMPVGPRGLEMTEKLKDLNGRRVRILGFMVRQARPSPGIAILASYAQVTNEGDYGLCDDLPPAVLFVDVPKYHDIAVPYSPGPLLLTGRLELGARQEADGRISYVRLFLDPAPEPSSERAAVVTPVRLLHTRR